MSGLKQLRNRVKSIKSTQKITRAMQVVSASKLQKVKEVAEDLNDYSTVLANIMYDISTHGNMSVLPMCDQRFFADALKQKPTLLVVLTSERGLCGGFNATIIKKVKKDIKKLKSENKEFKLIIVGKKGYNALRGEYSNDIAHYYNVYKDNYACIAKQVKDKIINMVEEGHSGSCYMYYNKFKNAMTQILQKQQILPVEKTSDKERDVISEYEYEGENLVHDVINLYFSGLVKYALLQSKASEEGARMTAMDNATRNAADLIDKLTLKLNRSRQAIITTELTEIISGAEAL